MCAYPLILNDPKVTEIFQNSIEDRVGFGVTVTAKSYFGKLKTTGDAPIVYGTDVVIDTILSSGKERDIYTLAMPRLQIVDDDSPPILQVNLIYDRDAYQGILPDAEYEESQALLLVGMVRAAQQITREANPGSDLFLELNPPSFALTNNPAYNVKRILDELHFAPPATPKVAESYFLVPAR